MSEVRSVEAGGLLARGHANAGNQLLKVSGAYWRCADELGRVLGGELPPAPGEDWPNAKLRDAADHNSNSNANEHNS